MGFGGLGSVSLARARELAVETRAALALGNDPIVSRDAAERSAVVAPTFGAMAETVIASVEHGWRNEKHRAQWRSTLAAYCGPIRAKPVCESTTQDVLAIVRDPEVEQGGGCRPALHSPRKTAAERVRREFQRPLTRRVPERNAVLVAQRGPGAACGLAWGLQPRAPALGTRQPHTGRVPPPTSCPCSNQRTGSKLHPWTLPLTGGMLGLRSPCSAPLLVEMAPLPSFIPPCQTADPWVCMSCSPCGRKGRGLSSAIWNNLSAAPPECSWLERAWLAELASA